MTKIQRKIVAIGGGEIRTKGTLKIDKYIIKLSNKKIPNVLFIPTASSDHSGYCAHIKKYYQDFLKCRVDTLLLMEEKPSIKLIKQKIQKANIIYVGGGNTLQMMKLWRKLGVDKLLKKAWKDGTVLCGISAGSICWFDSGHSDSMSFYNSKSWKYINVKGLGFVKGVHCPHYNGETLNIPRKSHFRAMMQKISGIGIAIDNNAAIAFIDDKYQVITSKKDAKAFQVYKRNGKVISKSILQDTKLRDVKELYLKNNKK